MNKKAAIGLSINTLVIIIISLVVLGSGVTLLYKFIGGAEDTKALLDSRTSAELERLLVSEGKRVALPLHRATVRRGETHTFGVGMMNIGGSGTTFRIVVDPVKFVDEEGNTGGSLTNIETEILKQWLLYNDQHIQIQEGEHHKESILVNPHKEALKGQYIFNAKVYSVGDTDADTKQYGNTQKFYVTVA
jgi:hypothetical protein